MKKHILLTTVITFCVAATAVHASCNISDNRYMNVQVANFSNSKLLLDMGKLTHGELGIHGRQITILPHHDGKGVMCSDGNGAASHIHLYRMPGHHDLVEWEVGLPQHNVNNWITYSNHSTSCYVQYQLENWRGTFRPHIVITRSTRDEPNIYTDTNNSIVTIFVSCY